MISYWVVNLQERTSPCWWMKSSNHEIYHGQIVLRLGLTIQASWLVIRKSHCIYWEETTQHILVMMSSASRTYCRQESSWMPSTCGWHSSGFISTRVINGSQSLRMCRIWASWKWSNMSALDGLLLEGKWIAITKSDKTRGQQHYDKLQSFKSVTSYFRLL